eukprot:2763575-Amphidinium_carterae.1
MLRQVLLCRAAQTGWTPCYSCCTVSRFVKICDTILVQCVRATMATQCYATPAQCLYQSACTANHVRRPCYNGYEMQRRKYCVPIPFKSFRTN